MKFSTKLKYKTSGGYNARFVTKLKGSLEHKYLFVFVNVYGDETPIRVNREGLTYQNHGFITTVSPYEDFKIDDKVMVKDEGVLSWSRRHFAGVSDEGKPQTFVDGTKWSSGHARYTWDECRKPTEQELAE